MINITEETKSQCCGCNACGDVCTRHAIIFKMITKFFGTLMSTKIFVPTAVYVRRCAG